VGVRGGEHGHEVSTISTPAVAVADRRATTRPRPRPRFYVGLAAFMVAIVVVGFWPSYFGPLLRGNVTRPLVIQVHGIIFVGWMALLVAQVLLAARGRVDLHRKIGRFGIVYGCVVLAMGIVAGPAASMIHIRAGEWTRDQGAGFLLTTFGDMLLFGSLFAAAVAYRRRPEIHKRLMLAATVALLFAAVGRMKFLEPQPLLAAAVWLSPLFVGMAHDWMTRRRVHSVYIIATVVLFLGALRVLFAESAMWLAIGRPIIAALM
jgi:hypothetical protein